MAHVRPSLGLTTLKVCVLTVRLWADVAARVTVILHLPVASVTIRLPAREHPVPDAVHVVDPWDTDRQTVDGEILADCVRWETFHENAGLVAALTGLSVIIKSEVTTSAALTILESLMRYSLTWGGFLGHLNVFER